MKSLLAAAAILLTAHTCFCWGFYGHRQINYYAVFLLPPEMLLFYKKHIGFLQEHAVDPDKRRYAVTAEAPRHFLDIDRYGTYPYDSLPREWNRAVERYTADTLNAHGIVPWWIQVMLARLTAAFRDKDPARILKNSAELGHYIADSHVPLHATRNHNGQYTNQKGIHGFWESRVPELLADREWDFFIGQAAYIRDPLRYSWDRLLESAAAVDTVLKTEKALSARFPADQVYSFEERNSVVTRQYSSAYTRAYDASMKGMVERRMRVSIFSVASFWYTAWVNAGQPDLGKLSDRGFGENDLRDFEELNQAWKKAGESGDH
ncbi:MAG: S1/P1 Nuclease [Chitinophagaceae bacterium]|nr:MAG: S1/P1 Nuclease [Chitinophagaceae bacterium]